MSNIEEVKATVARGTESADHARQTLIGVLDHIRQARQLSTVTQGSAHDRVQLGNSQIGQADTDVDRALALLRSAVDEAQQYSRSLDA